MKITQEELKKHWEYNAETDSFTWLTGTKFRKIGSSVSANPRIFLDNNEYTYLRLKDLYLYGSYSRTQVSNPITWEELDKIISYNPETGEFHWKEHRGPLAKRGELAGSVENTGYISIRIGRVPYLAHRLAWFYCFQEWPTKNVDHIDRDRSNNRLDNLRELSQVWNSRNRKLNSNNTSGYVGVYLDKRRNLWVADIIINKTKYRLGYFNTAELAGQAYKEFEKEHTYENISIG